jgi:hypothetical protein
LLQRCTCLLRPAWKKLSVKAKGGRHGDRQEGGMARRKDSGPLNSQKGTQVANALTGEISYTHAARAPKSQWKHTC